MPTLSELHEQKIQELSAPGGPFATTTKDINGVTYKVFENYIPSLRDFFAFGAGHGDKDFLVYEGERYTFNSANQEVCDLAHALSSKYGVKKNDKVALLLRNYPEWPLGFMAVTSMGAVIVPMNAFWKTEELEYGLQDCGAKVVIADHERVEFLRPIAEKLGLTIIGVRCEETELPAGGVHYKDLLAEAGTGHPWPDTPIDLEDDATIFYTSGTTGHPKGVVSTHRAVLTTLTSWTLNVMAQTAAVAELTPPAEGEVAPDPATLVALPLFHVTGSHAVFLMSILAGRKMVLMYKWDPTRALELIQEEKVTDFTGVPTMSWELVQHPDLDKYDISTLKGFGSGGAARPAEQAKKIAERFPDKPPASGYGMTETNAIGCLIGGEDYQRKPKSTGKPVPPVTEIAIWDLETGKPVPQGERGEIMIKSAANMRCYWNKPEATVETITDGWLHTGDIGIIDEEGFVFIVDRAKEIVIRGGENISVTEVEHAIHEMTEVAEVAIFGVPDERLGEEMCAIISLESGANLTEEQVRDYLKQHLASFKIPRYIRIQSEQLMRGATGKIYKIGMKQLVLEELGLEA